jgi:hypothetical protein
MKFRCKVTNDGLKILNSIVNSLLRIPSSSSVTGTASDNVTFVLSEQYLRIAIISENSVENPRAYVELLTQLLCSEYQIESQNENNLILFEINLFLLSKALNSGKYSMNTILKLTKKEGKPYLTMECKAAESLSSVDLFHDIPINLVRVLDFSFFLPPNISKPSIAFQLPKPAKTFKTLVDRMSKLNKILYLVAQSYSSNNNNGENNSNDSGSAVGNNNNNNSRYGQLKLMIENNNVKIQSFVNNLLLSQKLFSSSSSSSGTTIVPTTTTSSSSASPMMITKKPVVISVYSKKFSLILDYQNIAYHEATLCKLFEIYLFCYLLVFTLSFYFSLL